MLVLKPEELSTLAARLDRAEREASQLEPLTAERPALGLAEAYRVQAALVRLKEGRGEKVVGYKMGLTSKAKMEQMGVREPIFGVLTDRMRAEDGGTLALRGTIHPRIEPEIAFRLARGLSGRPSLEEALAACDGVCAALEIIDSRFRDFKFTLPDVIADNCSSCAFVLGPWAAPRGAADLSALAMTLSIDGKERAKGSSAAICGHPVLSLVELCGMLAERGLSLSAGDVVLAGAATQAVPLETGASVEAAVEGLGRVRISAR